MLMVEVLVFDFWLISACHSYKSGSRQAAATKALQINLPCQGFTCKIFRQLQPSCLSFMQPKTAKLKLEPNAAGMTEQAGHGNDMGQHSKLL